MDISGSSTRDSSIESAASLLITRPLRTLFTFKTSFGTAAVADGISPEEYETWVAGFEDYPVDHRYYEIVHESLRDQCAHYYLFLKDSNGMTRAIQPFLIVSQDLATGTPAFIRNALAQVRRLVPGLLKLRMLMVGMFCRRRRHCSGESESRYQLDGGCAEGELNSGRSPAEGGSYCFQGLPEILPSISGQIARFRVYAAAEHAGHPIGSGFFGFRGLPEKTRQLHDAEKPTEKIPESSERAANRVGRCHGYISLCRRSLSTIPADPEQI